MTNTEGGVVTAGGQQAARETPRATYIPAMAGQAAPDGEKISRLLAYFICWRFAGWRAARRAARLQYVDRVIEKGLSAAE